MIIILVILTTGETFHMQPFLPNGFISFPQYFFCLFMFRLHSIRSDRIHLNRVQWMQFMRADVMCLE